MTNEEKIGFDVSKEVTSKPKESLRGKIKYAAKNMDKLNDFELRELYNEISKKKMQRRISRKALIIKIKDKHDAWSLKREDKKAKKQNLKEEIRKLKEKLNV